MEILYPMVISAVAVLATLIYASSLDIKDRRVPFRTWYPMLIVGIPATAWFLYEKTSNPSLIAGFLALVATLLYVNYLDCREVTDRFNFTWLAIVLILPALAWIILSKFNLAILPWYAMFAGLFGYVTYIEYTRKPEGRTKPGRRPREATVADTLGRWYFVLIIIIFAITSVIMLFSGGWGTAAFVILFSSVFCGVFSIFGKMHLFGGADAWALILLAFCVPVFPITPLLYMPPLGFLPFSVLINALILNLLAPVALFIINIVKGNRAPLMYLFSGFPVRGDRIQESWGFVMEDFEENKGTISRKFIGFSDSLRRMVIGVGRVYTKDLREHPEDYTHELAMYKKAGTVWISYAVPFIVPITAGLVTAIVFGDLLLAITTLFIRGA